MQVLDRLLRQHRELLLILRWAFLRDLETGRRKLVLIQNELSGMLHNYALVGCEAGHRRRFPLLFNIAKLFRFLFLYHSALESVSFW